MNTINQTAKALGYLDAIDGKEPNIHAVAVLRSAFSLGIEPPTEAVYYRAGYNQAVINFESGALKL